MLVSFTCTRGSCEITTVTGDDIISKKPSNSRQYWKKKLWYLKNVRTRCLCLGYLLFPLHITNLGWIGWVMLQVPERTPCPDIFMTLCNKILQLKSIKSLDKNNDSKVLSFIFCRGHLCPHWAPFLFRNLSGRIYDVSHWWEM